MRKTTKQQQADIVIVGNGLAGLAMAMALAKANIASVLIGSFHQPLEDGRTTAIMQGGVTFLQTLGLWNESALQPVPLQTMRLISGKADIIFPASEIDLPQFGFNVTNAKLKTFWLQQIAAMPQITMVDAQVTVINTNAQNMPVITCDNGETITARLLIAADGRQSIVRDFANIGLTSTALDQHALVCIVAADQPHHFTSTEWYHSGGPFTLVPMQGNQMAVVYCDIADKIAGLKRQSNLDLGDYFTDFSNSEFGTLRVINTPQSWPVQPQQADALIAPHVALIGEAAHVMPPLAAQGFNTSLRDIEALQHNLQQAYRLGLDCGHVSTLQSYADQRRLDIRLRGTSVNWLNTIIRQDGVIGRRAHQFAFRALDALTPLKKLLMRTALAPTTRNAA